MSVVLAHVGWRGFHEDGCSASQALPAGKSGLACMWVLALALAACGKTSEPASAPTLPAIQAPASAPVTGPTPAAPPMTRPLEPAAKPVALPPKPPASAAAAKAAMVQADDAAQAARRAAQEQMVRSQ